jgi:phospholipid-transporting ATPase
MYAYQGAVVWGNGRDGGYLVLGNMVYTVSFSRETFGND